MRTPNRTAFVEAAASEAQDKPQEKRVTLRIPMDVYEAMQAAIARRPGRIPQNTYIVEAIDAYTRVK